MYRLLAVLAVTACGRVGFDADLDDPGVDGGSTSFDDLGPFAPGEPVGPLAAPGIDAHPTLTGDLLELYFASDRGGGLDIWRSVRASADDPWGAPRRVAELSADADDDSPEVSLDGLEIWFASARDGGAGGLDVWTATRASRDAPWSAPVHLPELASGAGDHSPFVDAHGTTMILTSRRDGGAGARDLYMSTRAGRGGSWSTPVALAELNSAGQDADAFLDASGRTLLFSSDRDSGDFRDLYIAERPDRRSTFGPPRLLDDLNTARADADPWLSPDFRTLVFSSSRGGDDDVYEATR